MELCCFLVTHVPLNTLLSFCKPLFSQRKLSTMVSPSPNLKELGLIRRDRGTNHYNIGIKLGVSYRYSTKKKMIWKEGIAQW